MTAVISASASDVESRNKLQYIANKTSKFQLTSVQYNMTNNATTLLTLPKTNYL